MWRWLLTAGLLALTLLQAGCHCASCRESSGVTGTSDGSCASGMCPRVHSMK